MRRNRPVADIALPIRTVATRPARLGKRAPEARVALQRGVSLWLADNEAVAAAFLADRLKKERPAAVPAFKELHRTLAFMDAHLSA